MPCKANQYMHVVMKSRKAEQGEPMLELPLSGGHIYIPSEHHVTFPMFAIATRPFTCVCFSKISFHLCLLQQNILTPVCPSKPSFDITDFANKPEVSASPFYGL